MLSLSKDRQICLWDSNRLEVLQAIKDLNSANSWLSSAALDLNLNQLYLAAKKMKIFTLQKDPLVEQQAQEVKKLLQEMNLDGESTEVGD